MKKRGITSVMIIFYLSIFCSCEFNKQYLGDNYYYLPEYEAIDIGFPDGAIVYKSKKRYVFNNIVIHANVVGVRSNDKYIVAGRKSPDLNLQYFIIDKESNQIYGPFNKQEYLKQRKDLGVSERLTLNEVNNE